MFYGHFCDIVNTIKTKSSSGHDEISAKLMKATITHLINPITHIINQSLQTGIVPDQMKIAKVFFLINHFGTNYRPINLLSAFSKVLERAMYNQLMTFLTTNNILYKHQYGFRPNHSSHYSSTQPLWRSDI